MTRDKWKEIWEKICFKLDSASSMSIIHGFRLWHMAYNKYATWHILNFGQNELKSIYKNVGYIK
jgi:hypothetical protein